MRRVIKTVFDPDGTPRQIPVLRDFFIYPVYVDILPTDTTPVIRSINIAADSDFVWLKTTYLITGSADTQISTSTIPPITVEIKDVGSSRELQSSPTYIHNIAGRGIWPAIQPEPRTFKANSTVQFKFVNLINGVETEYKDLYLNLIGYKEWR